MKKRSLVIDRSLCDGNGVCVQFAPDHLKINEDEELELIRAEVRNDERRAIGRAIQSCPKAALAISESPI